MNIMFSELKKYHVPDVIKMDEKLCLIKDPDFGDINPFKITESAISEIIKQYNKPLANDTRSYACHVDGKIVGAFSYEITPISYEILFLVTELGVNQKSVVEEIIKLVKEKADKSAKRKKVHYYVNDRDVRLSVLLPLLKQFGFKINLYKDYFPFMTDGWKCSYESDNHVEDDTKYEDNTGGSLATV